MLRFIAMVVLGIGSWLGVAGVGLSVAAVHYTAMDDPMAPAASFWFLATAFFITAITLIYLAAWIDEKFQASTN